MNRSLSTISRELRRNRTAGENHAAQTQQQAEQRRRERPLVRKMDDLKIDAAVRRGLAQGWSPEQIAGQLHRDPLKKSVVRDADGRRLFEDFDAGAQLFGAFSTG